MPPRWVGQGTNAFVHKTSDFAFEVTDLRISISKSCARCLKVL